MQNTSKSVWVLVALAASAMFAVVAPFTVIAEQAGLLPAYAVFYRYVIIMLITTPFILLFARSYFNFNRHQFWLVMLQACAAATLSLTYMASFSFIPLSLAVIIFFTAPIITLMVVPFVFGHRLSPAKMAIFFVAFLGLIFVVGPEFSNLNGLGISLAFIAAICGVIQLLCMSKLVKEISSIALIYSVHLMAMFISFFVLVTLIYTGNIAPPVALNVDMSVNLVGIVGFYMLAYVLLTMVAKYLQPATISFVSNVEPIITVALAIWLFNESFSNIQAFGVVIVLTALVAGSLYKEKTPNEQPAE
ncbi:MAG: DMT family transporter [Rhizobiales bacterium]|nr:DMT family transporter [Hyphomicrobiales bacterium]NRB15663.1 DMT family transporter [Hyphomicrobiales bacterium]